MIKNIEQVIADRISMENQPSEKYFSKMVEDNMKEELSPEEIGDVVAKMVRRLGNG